MRISGVNLPNIPRLAKNFMEPHIMFGNKLVKPEEVQDALVAPVRSAKLNVKRWLRACILSTLVFGGVYYCRQQRAFRRADRRNEVPAQFSNTTTRKYGKRGGRVPREYNARNAL